MYQVVYTRQAAKDIIQHRLVYQVDAEKVIILSPVSFC